MTAPSPRVIATFRGRLPMTNARVSMPQTNARAPMRARTRLPREVHDGERCYRVERAWPRGTEHALLELSPLRPTVDGADPGQAAVAAQWFADPARLAAVAAKTPGGRVADGVLLQPEGADAQLPALGGVLARPGAQLVAHRPGRRAVVRVPAGDGVEYVKVVRPAKADALARRGRLVRALLDDSVVVPELLGDGDVRDGVLRWSDVGGTTLHALGADPARTGHEVRAAWAVAGRAVRLLHGADRAAVLDEHGVEDELAAIGTWLAPAVHHGLLDAGQVERATELVARGLRAAPARPVLGVLHRDLHDKQVLLRPDGRLGMIDVDTLAVGERALDVANVLVHLELRVAQGLLTARQAEAARTGLLTGVGEPLEQLWARVPAYAAATRLRLAGVYAFRPRWLPLAREMLADVDGSGGTGGL
ncbi:phosphotransferase family protein [Georgenia subflava]|uniref:phosphotransferase family protein n=1 Tax=Georgenia subflava TaxID=1622177 RepID=UPI0012659A0B|nr:hypothetical protein [Georgenia subflava]